jgi:uncharacterized membrane protein YfcA
MDPSIVVLGFGVGALVGLTGMGGAALLTPVLILFFDVRPIMAIGSDLVYQAVTKGFGAFQHRRQGTVNGCLVRWLAIGGVPASVAGIALARLIHIQYVSGADQFLGRMVSVALLMAGVIVIFRLFHQPRRHPDIQALCPYTRRMRVFTVIMGAVVGFTVSLTSVGSGSILLPLLLLVYSLRASQAVGVDIFFAAIIVAVSGLGHSLNGNVDFRLVANLLVGSIPGVLLGSRLSMKVPDRALRPGLATLLIGLSLRLW